MDSSVKSRSEYVLQTIAHVVMIIASLAAILPFLLLITSSLTSENELLISGYTFFPEHVTTYAYEYLFTTNGENVLRAYGVTVLITAVGTSLSLLIAPMLAYVISRSDYPRRKFLAFFVLCTMLFNGGLVPFYIMWTQLFHIKNTIFALIIPRLLMNGFSIMLMRNFFQTSIHPAMIEAAKIDGAGELKTYYKIVLPLSLPILATIGLMTGIMYWNDWEMGLYFISNPKLYSLQNLLNRIITSIQFLASMSKDVSVSVEMPSTAVRMALAVIGVIPILTIYPFFQKFFAKGISLGGVKG